MTIFTDLILDDGNLINIECPDDFQDELYETLNNAMRRKDCWAPSQFEGCKAEYLGINLDRVNMMKVVGFL